MRALILAAGRGERMRPLTDTTPKPLLPVGGKPLVAWHIEKLAALGVRDIVVNIAHLAERFAGLLGDGSRWGVRLHWSREGERPLETGGALLHARALLGEAPFLLVNGDVWTDFDFARLPAEPAGLAHLVLVDRPAEKARGDFALHEDGKIAEDHVSGASGDAANGQADRGPGRSQPLLTYAGIGVYRMALLDGWVHVLRDHPGAGDTPPHFPLAPLLRAAMRRGAVTGQHHRGRWTDVGTPERLAALDASLAHTPSHP